MIPRLARPTKALSGFAKLILLPCTALPLLGQYQDFWEDFDTTRSASLSATYNDSIFGNSSNVADTILQGSLRGALTKDFNFATFGIEANASFAQFLEYDDLNYEDITFNWIIDLSEQLGNSRFKISANANANETSSTNADVVGRATVRTYEGRLQASYVLTSRMTANASVSYIEQDPQGSVTAQVDSMGNIIAAQDIYGTETLSGNLGLDWKTKGKFSYTLDATASQIDSERPNDSTQDVYSLRAGVNGVLTARISGNLSVGYGVRETDLDSTSTPLIRGRLTYKVDNLSSFNLTAARSLEVSLNGSDSEITTLGLGYDRQVTRKLTFNASAVLGETDYTGAPGSPTESSRESLILRSSLSYPIYSWLYASADVQWESQESDLVSLDSNGNPIPNVSGDYESFRVGITFSAVF